MLAMGLSGFIFGIIQPARDMLVRRAARQGPAGIVKTGFNIGGIIAPLIFGAIMDHGTPRLVFLTVAALSLVAILTVATRPRRPV